MSRPGPVPARPHPPQRVLVTGAAGFVGRHLARELSAAGHRVLTTDLAADAPPDLPDYRPADLRDRAALATLLRESRPDACVHLAAVSFVPDGDRDPAALLAINIGGTVNLLEALRTESPRTRLLLVSTAQVYGPAAAPDAQDRPLPEDAPCLPVTLYAISKAACEQAVFGHAAAHGLEVLVARPANHTGPGQSPRFVAAAFARQVRDVAAGRAHEIQVGNLDSIRDFTDVRDVVRAYRLLLEQGTAGRAYNISANHRVRIGELLDRLQALAGTRAPLRTDPERVRRADAAPPLDIRRLQKTTGWAPAFTLDGTLRDLLQTG